MAEKRGTQKTSPSTETIKIWQRLTESIQVLTQNFYQPEDC